MVRKKLEASLPERGNGPLPWSGPQKLVVVRTPESKATVEPGTKQAVEAVRIGASLFQAHL